jgi:two-component system sensor histidine kinase KdpD
MQVKPRSTTGASSAPERSTVTWTTPVNIRHLEIVNDAVARTTGVRVRETVPDTSLHRTYAVIDVGLT